MTKNSDTATQSNSVENYNPSKIERDLLSQSYTGKNIAAVLKCKPILAFAIASSLAVLIAFIFTNYTLLNIVVSSAFLSVSLWIMYFMSKKGNIKPLPFKILAVGYIVEIILILVFSIYLSFVKLPETIQSSSFLLIALEKFGFTPSFAPFFVFLTTSTSVWISPFLLIGLFSILSSYKNPSKRVKLVKFSSIVSAIIAAVLIVLIIVDIICVSNFKAGFDVTGISSYPNDPAFYIYQFFTSYLGYILLNIISSGFMVAALIYWSRCLLKINDACQYTSVINITIKENQNNANENL